MPWSSTEVTTWPSEAVVRIVIWPPSGLNFTALWTRLTTTCPSRVASPRTGGSPGGVSNRNVTPCRSPKSRRRSAESAARRLISTPSAIWSVPPLSMRLRSSSSLTIWTR